MLSFTQTASIVSIKKSEPFNGFQKRILFFAILSLTFICCLAPYNIAAAEKPQKASAALTKDDEDVSEFIIPAPDAWKGDFDGMKDRGRIRILVPPSKTFFFYDKARSLGTAADLGRAFEAWINKKYKLNTFKIHVVFLPTRRDQLFRALNEGYGDIAMGNLTITPERLKQVDFSDPVADKVKEVVVTGPKAPALHKIEDLGGKEIYVRRSSSYHEHLLGLNRRLKKKIILKAAEEDLEDEDLLEMVNAGLLPLAIVDDHKAEFWAQVFDSIKVRTDLAVNTGGRIASAVRKNSPLLLAELNAFIHSHVKKTGLINVLLQRYLKSTRYVKNATAQKEMQKCHDAMELFKKYGEKYNFDHLMLLAQGYQESGLEQSAKSPRGAVGIMQLLPSTAEGPPIGIQNVDTSEENNVHAGVKYLRWLADNFVNDPQIDAKNRTLMVFAGYNAGPGNLRKFRKVAEKSGLDPNIWFGNVEQAAAKVVGRETVHYVANIYKYYIAYRLWEEHHKEKEK